MVNERYLVLNRHGTSIIETFFTEAVTLILELHKELLRLRKRKVWRKRLLRQSFKFGYAHKIVTHLTCVAVVCIKLRESLSVDFVSVSC